MLDGPTKEHQIGRLVEDLAREYPDHAAEATVADVVRTEYDRLYRESRVEEFVPILAERRARARLGLRRGHRRTATAVDGSPR